MNLPVYCINLDSRRDRWERMYLRFAEDHISVERFSAVTGHDARIRALLEQNPGLTPGTAACALSHQDAWRLALARGHERVLILEDDVFFQRSWKAILEDCLSRLDRDDPEWDLFMLNGAGFHTWEHGLRVTRPALVLTGAYVVNAHALRSLLTEFADRLVAADVMLVWLQQLRAHSYFHFPYLALQEFADSDIGPDQEGVHSLRRWYRDHYEPHFGSLYRERFQGEYGPWKKPVRLHLGCGASYLDGYINVDYPEDQTVQRRNRRPDLECDLRTLHFEDGTVTEIRSHHVFEHFDRVDALRMLMLWTQWLRVDGALVVETPDFESAARRFVASNDDGERMKIVRHLFGSNEAEWAAHRDGWWSGRFHTLFESFGYEIVSVEHPDDHYWNNVLVRATRRRGMTRDELLRASENILRDSAMPEETALLENWFRRLHSSEW